MSITGRCGEGACAPAGRLVREPAASEATRPSVKAPIVRRGQSRAAPAVRSVIRYPPSLRCLGLGLGLAGSERASALLGGFSPFFHAAREGQARRPLRLLAHIVAFPPRRTMW